MRPDVVQAVAYVLVAGLGAWQARMQAKLRDLEARLSVVEKERDRFRQLLRAAVRHIRDWMAWGIIHAPGTPPPPLPPELRNEV